MKPHRRDKSDSLITRVIKAGLLNHRPAASDRFRLLRAVAVDSFVGDSDGRRINRPDWTTPSTARRMRRQRWSMEGRKYGSIVVAASFRLAW